MSGVSIVIPIYNAEKTLERCLESIRLQTFTDIEVLMINDGSTDSSEVICQRYSNMDNRFKLISQKNSGPATARNEGIQRANGLYLSFVDADDYVESDMIESMFLVAMQHSTEMVICSYYQESGDKVQEHRYKYKTGLYKGEQLEKIAIELINDVSSKRIPPYSWVRLISRKVFEDTGLCYSNGMIRSEDYYLYVQMHFKIKSLYLFQDKCLYHYIEEKASITHRYVAKYFDSVKEIYSGLRNVLPQNAEIINRLNVMMLQRTMIAANNAVRAVNNDARQELKDILYDSSIDRVISELPVWYGCKEIGAFYILAKLKCKKLIYIRYALKI